MSFIFRTRLLHLNNKELARIDGIAEEKKLYKKANLAYTKENRKKHFLKYDLKVCYAVNVKGITRDGHLLYDAIFWQDKKTRDQNLPPILKNSFILQPTGKESTDYTKLMIDAIEEYLMRASLRGETGDKRDTEVLFAKTKDPSCIFNNPGVNKMKDAIITKT